MRHPATDGGYIAGVRVLEGGSAMRDRTDGSAEGGETAAQTLHRRNFLASAAKVGVAFAAAPSAAGVLARAALAHPAASKRTLRKDVKEVGFDHPFNFVAYVSDLQ